MAFSSFCILFALANASGLASLACPKKYRSFWMMSLLTSSVLAFQRLGEVPIPADSASVLGLFIVIWIAHLLSIILSLQALGGKVPSSWRSSEPTRKPGGWHWKMAYKLLYNSRWIGTSVEVTSTRVAHVGGTKGSATKKEEPLSDPWRRHLQQYLASPRIAFLAVQIRHLLIIAAVSKLLSAVFLDPRHRAFQPLRVDDIQPALESYFRRLGEATARETAIRFLAVFYFVWNAYAMLSSMHAAFSIMFVVLLQLDLPDEWPPLFGDIRNATSVGRFWTAFWHSLAYRPYNAMAGLVLGTMLGIRPGSALHRLLRNSAIFLCSGISHALVMHQLLPCGARAEIWWFMANFVAVVLENHFDLAVKRLKLRPGSQGGQFLWRIAGYCWTLGFMFWSLPKLLFLQLRCATPGAV
jgi:hypothetical protein